jgi:hypothetical protein
MGHVILERLDAHDLPSVQALLEACEAHFVATTGRRAPAGAARSLFTRLPDGATYVGKHVLGICDSDTRELMGLIDAVSGHPEPGTLAIGLFLVSPWYVEGSVPQVACRLLEAWARERRMSRLRIAIHASSVSVLHFWQTEGFVADAEPIRDGRRLVVVFEKRLANRDAGDVGSTGAWLL